MNSAFANTPAATTILEKCILKLKTVCTYIFTLLFSTEIYINYLSIFTGRIGDGIVPLTSTPYRGKLDNIMATQVIKT